MSVGNDRWGVISPFEAKNRPRLRRRSPSEVDQIRFISTSTNLPNYVALRSRMASKFGKIDQVTDLSIMEEAIKVKQFTIHRDRQNGLQVRQLPELPITFNQNEVFQTLPEGSKAHAVGFMTDSSTRDTAFSKLAEKAIADNMECRTDFKDCRERIKSLYGSISEERERRARLQEKSQRPSNEPSYYRGIAAVIDLGPDGNSHPSLSRTPTWKFQFEIPRDIQRRASDGLSANTSPLLSQDLPSPVSRKPMNEHENIAPHYTFEKTLDHVMTNCNEAVVGLNMRQSILKKALGSVFSRKGLAAQHFRQMHQGVYIICPYGDCDQVLKKPHEVDEYAKSSHPGLTGTGDSGAADGGEARMAITNEMDDVPIGNSTFLTGTPTLDQQVISARTRCAELEKDLSKEQETRHILRDSEQGHHLRKRTPCPCHSLIRSYSRNLSV
ncbi:unnamed protein product [Fusarium equiseti]|uniref:Uncharacterized protein n=1 Tax=Fusarium equiseti TaxID=61235 RepID=A0A8J2IF63_FUSEQ|nr:unnamed protein product [Fusarium equiseti]